MTGLTTAYHLRQHGYQVTVLDHPHWQDGFQSNASDAAPVLFGCHHETWGLLRFLNNGANPAPDTTLPLEFRLPDGRVVAYQSTHLPGALQWMMSLFSFRGLSWKDRWKLFSHLEQIWEQAQALPSDLESRIADEWLATVGQSAEARACIWDPLSQWLTGNALTRLSAATFVRLVSTLFLGHATDARLTYLDGTVGDRFLVPLRNTLGRLHTTLHSLTELPRVRFAPDRVAGVHLADGTVLQAEKYVAAVSHQKLLALLPERLLTRYAYFAQLEDLSGLSEHIVRLTYRSTVRTPRVMLLADRSFQQLTITPLGPQEVGCRLTAIGNDALAHLSDDRLAALGRTELHALIQAIRPDDIRTVQVSRRDNAALLLQPGVALLRPLQQSPIPNLLVSGSWTDTGWPANVESALISARRCAEAITTSPA